MGNFSQCGDFLEARLRPARFLPQGRVFKTRPIVGTRRYRPETRAGQTVPMLTTTMLVMVVAVVAVLFGGLALIGRARGRRPSVGSGSSDMSWSPAFYSGGGSTSAVTREVVIPGATPAVDRTAAGVTAAVAAATDDGSSLSASIGLRRPARRAGTKQARNAVSSRRIAADTNVTPSWAWMKELAIERDTGTTRRRDRWPTSSVRRRRSEDV